MLACRHPPLEFVCCLSNERVIVVAGFHYLRIFRRWACRAFYRSCQEERRKKGVRLLQGWLTPEQRLQFDRKGYFEVLGSDTGTRYRIRRGTSANVREVDASGRLGMGWCFVPVGELVEPDVMLVQKIALETSELETLAIAKNFYGW